MRAKKTVETERFDAAELGAMMRETRENLGHDLSAIAADLRIRLVYLEAIEAGRLGDLPGSAYVSGFLRAYSDYLGLDGEEMVRRFRIAGIGISSQTQLHLPSPVEEGRLPTGSILLLAALVAAAAYGGWYYFSASGRNVADTVDRVPAELAGLVDKDSTVAVPAAAPAGSEASPAAAVPADLPESPVAGAPAASPVPAASSPATASPAPASAAPSATDTPPPVSTSAAPSAAATVAPAGTTSPASAAQTPTVTAATVPATVPAAVPSPVESRAAAVESTAAATATAPPAARPPTVRPTAPAPTPGAPAPVAAPAVADTPPPAPQAAIRPPAAAPAASPQTAARSGDTAPERQGTSESERPAASEQAAEEESQPPTVIAAAPRSSDVGGPTRIVVRATADSFVAVQTRDNQTLFSQLMRPGDSYEVPSGADLLLDTGNAGGLEIIVGGRKAPSLGPTGLIRRGIPLEAEQLLSGAN